MVTTYLPVVAREVTRSTTLIGGLIAIEGVMALWLPTLVGGRSDRLRTRVGGRLPFVLAGAPPLVAALAALGFARSLWLLAALSAVFFAGYFVAYEPYRALYPDLVEEDIAGRSQASQALWRGAGTALALIGGGLLLGVAEPLPFVLAAAVVAGALSAFGVLGVRARRRRLQREGAEEPDHQRERGSLRALLAEDPERRRLLAANALWELSLGALKTFAVLYITVGLGRSRQTAALVVGGVALVVLVAAPVAGRLADRHGGEVVLRRALPLYGLGLIALPLVADRLWAVLPLIPVIAFGGGVIMTLPYAVLMSRMPRGRHGAVTGLYSLSRGVGTALGPLLAGAAISLLREPLAATEGYAAMWPVCGAAVLLSIPLVRGVRAR